MRSKFIVLCVVVLLNALHQDTRHFNRRIDCLGQYSAAVASGFMWQAGVEVIGSYSQCNGLIPEGICSRHCAVKHIEAVLLAE